VRLASIAAVLVLAVAASAAATAAPARTTVTGKIKVLRVKTITVHGTRNLTCRITAASPKATLRGFALGARAKITCSRGVLVAIAHPKPLAVTPVTPSGSASTPRTGLQPEPTITTPGTGGERIAPTVNGNGKITAVGGGQIEFGGDITCQVTSSSPSVAAYKVGALVSYTCAGGTLTAIGPGEGT
jgi:hypothetical protein